MLLTGILNEKIYIPYLLQLIHRDLAARNILLGEQYCVKISDFGLARDIALNENYVKTTSGLLPYKWMSPESMIDRVYNKKSDMYISFVITRFQFNPLSANPTKGSNSHKQFVGSFPTNCLSVFDQCYIHIQASQFQSICSKQIQQFGGGGGGTIFGEGFRVFRYSNYKFHDSYLTSYLCTD